MESTGFVSGLWDGYFEYGPAYEMTGERVTFKLFLTESAENRFEGRCMELEGVGMNKEIAAVTGFAEAGFISFVKTYPSPLRDEDGNEIKQKLLLHYSGNYDWNDHSFAGVWEYTSDQQDLVTGEIVIYGYGKWKMKRAIDS